MRFCANTIVTGITLMIFSDYDGYDDASDDDDDDDDDMMMTGIII